ncbi:MAG: hypothetical protein COA44_01125 [Arcobacter sp.]|nr:MAG: hypothetical protein COA44_01125 [Arcobacter sp.]
MHDATKQIDTILKPYLEVIGSDIGYINHTKRMLLYALELQDLDDVQKEKFIIALSFHDLGIWTEQSFDYLDPSVCLAQKYLKEHDKMEYKKDVVSMINLHHKLTPIKDNDLAELFRKVDMIDVYWGAVSFGIDKKKMKEIKKAFPNNSFHLTLMKWFGKRLLTKPWSPMPMLKW